MSLPGAVHAVLEKANGSTLYAGFSCIKLLEDRVGEWAAPFTKYHAAFFQCYAFQLKKQGFVKLEPSSNKLVHKEEKHQRIE